VLLRSDNLQDLTAADIAALSALGLSRVVDLRTTFEVESEGPGPLVGSVEIRHRSVYPEKGETTDVIISAEDGEHPAATWYLSYLRHRPDSVVAALSDIAEGPGAVLVHCAAGKDRTGVVIALALEVAGVPREEILADYLRTGERITAIMKRLRASPTYAADLEPYTDQSRMPRAEALEGVLEVLDAQFGGVEGWLAAHGFDPAPLRERLTRARTPG
jgi:protein tyrosine/serine phosphatase